jgi:hypothetical protein
MGAHRVTHILLHHTQNRVGAEDDTELPGKAESGFTAQSVTDLLQHLTMAIGLATIVYGEVREALREYLATAIL